MCALVRAAVREPEEMSFRHLPYLFMWLPSMGSSQPLVYGIASGAAAVALLRKSEDVGCATPDTAAQLVQLREPQQMLPPKNRSRRSQHARVRRRSIWLCAPRLE